MSRSLFVLGSTLAVVLTVAAFASSTPIGDLDPAVAPHATAPAVASSAHGSVLIWLDSRRYRSLDNDRDLYGSPVDVAGNLVEPAGTCLAHGVSSALIASNGDGYLVVFATSAGDIAALPLDDRGNARSTPTIIGRGFVWSATSNGRGYCALSSEGAVVLDQDGQPLTRIPLPVDFAQGFVSTPVVVAVGATYEVVQGRRGCSTFPCTLSIHVIEISGTAAIDHTVADGLRDTASTSAAAIDGRVFIGIGTDEPSTAQRVIQFLVTDTSGHVLTPLQTVSRKPTTSIGAGGAPLFAYDGRTVLIAWLPPLYADEPPALGVRVRSDGTPIDLQPFEMTPPPTYSLALSANGAITAAWIAVHRQMFAQPQLHVARFASVDALAVTEGDVVRAPAMQNDPEIAVSGSHALVVWREYDQPSVIRATSLDVMSGTSRTATIAPAGASAARDPAVAAIGNVALVAWVDEDGFTSRVFVRRVTLNGEVIDPQPLRVATLSGTEGDVIRGVSVATDGFEYLVVWTARHQLNAARVRADGTIVDGNPIPFGSNPGESTGVARMVWTGAQYIVVWIGARDNPIPDKPLPPYSTARVAVIKPSGQVAETMLFSGLGAVSDLDLSTGNDSILLAYSLIDAQSFDPYSICTYARLLDEDGQPRSDAKAISCDHLPTWRVYPRHVRTAWTGRSFAVVWANQSTADVHLTTVLNDGSVGADLSVTPPESNTFDPTVATSPRGFLVVYTAVADERPFAGTQRLFAEVLTSGGRRRSVIHR